MFKAIEREETLACRVTGEIETLILDQALATGTRLPAERELAGQFKVSRTVVREAVKALVAKGILEVKRGSGMLVSRPSTKAVTQSMALLLRGHAPDGDQRKISEVRRLLEVEIAGLAAARRTEADLDSLREILESTAGIAKSREKFVSWDVAFHAALAKATHNELFSVLLDSVAGTMRKVRELGFNVPHTPARAKYFHALIFEKVQAGDAAAARAAMSAHLDEAEVTMQKGLTRADK